MYYYELILKCKISNYYLTEINDTVRARARAVVFGKLTSTRLLLNVPVSQSVALLVNWAPCSLHWPVLMMSASRTVICLLRNDLRLHDNEVNPTNIHELSFLSVAEASTGFSTLAPEPRAYIVLCDVIEMCILLILITFYIKRNI